MRFLFFTPPAAGEVNPTLAISQAILNHSSDDEVYIASGPDIQGLVNPTFLAHQRLHLVVLENGGHGVTDTLHPSDYSTGLAHARGDPIPMYQYIESRGYSTVEGMLATVAAVKQALHQVKPDMVIVNGGSPCAFDTMRLLEIPFIRTSFSHPAGCFKVNPLTGSLPLSGVTWEGSVRNVVDNFKFVWKHIMYGQYSRLCRDVVAFRRKELRLEPLYFVDNGCYAPPSEMVPEVCCTILANVAGILPGYKYGPRPDCHFIGPCIQDEPASEGQSHAAISATRAWLDESVSTGAVVVLVNLGTLFKWTPDNTQRMLSALELAKASQPNLRVLWKADLADVPTVEYIRRERWFPSVKAVYTHPAIKAILHHGGGNTFNEALAYGIPQLVIPQWMDTFDYAVTVEQLGLGLQTTQHQKVLDSREIADKLNILLKERSKCMRTVEIWQERAKAASGPRTAAELIRDQAERQKKVYAEAFSLKDSLKHDM